jgi:hypothetical protein
MNNTLQKYALPLLAITLLTARTAFAASEQVQYSSVTTPSGKYSFDKPTSMPPGLKVSSEDFNLDGVGTPSMVATLSKKAAQNIASEKLPDAKITYRAMGKNWFVLSGTSGKNIFYKRTQLAKSIGASVLLVYPTQSKVNLDGTVTHIANSLKVSDTSNSTVLTESQAIDLVSNLPDVRAWRRNLEKTKGAGKAAYMTEKQGQNWNVHVVESRTDHNATFGWYDVNALTKKVKQAD